MPYTPVYHMLQAHTTLTGLGPICVWSVHCVCVFVCNNALHYECLTGLPMFAECEVFAEEPAGVTDWQSSSGQRLLPRQRQGRDEEQV